MNELLISGHIETRKNPNPYASFIIRSIHENPQNHIGPSTVKILSGVQKVQSLTDMSDEYRTALRGAQQSNRDFAISAQHSSSFNG
jgi:hypothetical protein